MVAEKPPAASRRGFLKALGLGATQAALPGAAEPAASTARTVAPVVVLPEARVAGAEKRLTVAERLALQPGMRLAFRREPENRFDKRAVLIELVEDGKPPRAIGYVPRHKNRTIADLIDAGHEVAGELLPSERFALHNRVRPGEVSDPEMRLIEEVKRTEDGGRIVKVEAVRPRFRAWIATGQIGEAKPPDPNGVPGEPGWTRIVAAHRASRLSYDAYFTHPIDWAVGMELALSEQRGSLPGWGMFDLLTLEGQRIGELEGPHQVVVHQALKEGRQVRVVVVGVGQQKWTGALPSPCPIIEVRASKAVAPPVLAEPGPKSPAPASARPSPESPARMTDIRLFRLAGSGIAEIGGATDTIEKSLQVTFERHLEALLGVRFLATEFAIDGGRIDTLGLDENDAPVILEFKRASNENVINQGLFYLDWLVTHRKDFQWLVLEKLGQGAANRVDWSAPRLICIAGDFSRYDAHAIKQVSRHIELIRYRRYGEDLLMLEKVASTAASATARIAPPAPETAEASKPAAAPKYKLISQTLDELDAGMRDRYEALRSHLMALGDDVEEVTTRFYIAFKRIKNFACVEFKPRDGRIMLFLKLDPSEVALEQGFTRDVAKIGHFGTGDLEVTLASAADLERAAPLIARSYGSA